MNPATIEFTVSSAVDFFPYGLELRSYGQSRYLTTQHERDVETGFDYRGARFYDSEVGRFLSVDPLAAKYVSLSTYNYVGGNPLSFVDPDGREIVIHYKEAKVGEDGKYITDEDGKYVYESKYVTYEYGQCNGCDNEFVKHVHEAFEFMIENGIQNFINDSGEEIDVISYLIDHHEKLTITGEASFLNVGQGYDHESQTISWNSLLATIYNPNEVEYHSMYEFTTPGPFDEAMPPSLTLLHEMGHTFLHFSDQENYHNLRGKADSQYDNYNEKWVIENLESPAARRLGIKPRTHHSGSGFPVDGPNSFPEKNKF